MKRRRVLTYTEEYKVPPPVLWSVISNTERMNQAGKTPFTPYEVEEVVDPDGQVLRYASKRMGPLTLRWRERFGEWVEGKSVTQVRHFDSGPFGMLAVALKVEETLDGSRLDAIFTAAWDGRFGSVLAALGVLKMMTKPLMSTVRDLVTDATSGGPQLSPAAYRAPTPSAGVRDRLDRAVGQLAASDYHHGLSTRLRDYLLKGNPLDLRQIRPLQLAREWGEEPGEVVELFLAAHKASLLSMRWEIMCPRCRGAKSTTETLADLTRNVHCDSCQIDYSRDFEGNVELVFSPEAWLRALPEGAFCMMGPASTPHIRVQCEVPPGETREEIVDLAPGTYRLRTVESGGETMHHHDGAGFPEIVVTPDEIAAGETREPGLLAMTNFGGLLRTVVVETTAWSDVALTGTKVIASQAFRDLCPEQLLRPGDEVAVGQVALLFSDLSGSTALYERIGDARAFGLVRAHFEFLEERVRLCGGAVVKTIGDAVMAAFTEGVRSGCSGNRDAGRRRGLQSGPGAWRDRVEDRRAHRPLHRRHVRRCSGLLRIEREHRRAPAGAVPRPRDRPFRPVDGRPRGCRPGRRPNGHVRDGESYRCQRPDTLPPGPSALSSALSAAVRGSVRPWRARVRPPSAAPRRRPRRQSLPCRRRSAC